MLQRSVCINFHKDIYTTISKVIYVHELPFLRMLHGDDSCEVVTDYSEHYQSKEFFDRVNKPREINATEEVDRLRGAYGRLPSNGEWLVDLILDRVNPVKALEAMGCDANAAPYREVKHVIVPDITGLNALEAAEMIGRTPGLSMGTREESWDDKYGANVIIGQTPAGGSTVEENTAVNLVISAGKKPGRKPKAPPRGQTADTESPAAA